MILNDIPLLNTDNMFRRWRVDCKKALKAGQNIMRIHFSSPINKVLTKIRGLEYPLPAPMDRGEKTSPYTRKAPSIRLELGSSSCYLWDLEADCPGGLGYG